MIGLNSMQTAIDELRTKVNEIATHVESNTREIENNRERISTNAEGRISMSLDSQMITLTLSKLFLRPEYTFCHKTHIFAEVLAQIAILLTLSSVISL